MSVATALAIGIDVDLELAHAMIELRAQRVMTIIEGDGRLRGELRQPFQRGRRDVAPIAVMCADDLYLIELDRVVHRCGMGGAQQRGKKGQGQGRTKAHRQILKAGCEASIRA